MSNEMAVTEVLRRAGLFGNSAANQVLAAADRAGNEVMASLAELDTPVPHNPSRFRAIDHQVAARQLAPRPTTIGSAAQRRNVAASANPSKQPANWKEISTEDGIRVSTRVMPGSKVHAVRGETVADIHISRLMAVFLDIEKETSWVKMLAVSEQVGEGTSHNFVLYQHYDLPFPISDRDYVMRVHHRSWPERGVFEAHLASVKHPLKPEQDCCVRAEIFSTFSRFTARRDGRTRIETEIFTDPKGVLPTWLVNLVQEDFPHDSIVALIERAREPQTGHHPDFVGW